MEMFKTLDDSWKCMELFDIHGKVWSRFMKKYDSWNQIMEKDDHDSWEIMIWINWRVFSKQLIHDSWNN